MQAKFKSVKTAITTCGEWYTARGVNIRTLSERIDALWLEVEHLLRLLEHAERENERKTATAIVERIIHYIIRIQSEVERQ